MRRGGPYREPYRWMAMTMARKQEEAMHPAVTQALVAERTRDLRAQSAALSLARHLRRERRSHPASAAVSPAVAQPCPEAPYAKAA